MQMLVEGGHLLQLLAACRKGMKQQHEQLQQQQLLEACAIPEVQVCESLALAICDLLHSQYDQQQQQQQQERTLKITLDKLVLANLELGFKKEAGLLLQQEAFRCLAMGPQVLELYSESGIDRLSLGLQLLLQASRLFMEADCTSLHLTCCRQAALVALQLRAVELQLSRECLQQQQQQQQQNGRHLVSLLLQHCSKSLEQSLHPFKDAEMFLKDGTDLPVLLSSLGSPDAATAAAASAGVSPLQLRPGEADTAAAAADAELQQRSAWFRSLLFSLEGSALQWFCRGDREGGPGGLVEGPAATPTTTSGAAAPAPTPAEAAAEAVRESEERAGAAAPAPTPAEAAAEAVRESEERAAASVGLSGPFLQFLHLSIAQVLLFVELHPDAFVSGLTAEAYQHIYGGVVQLAWPRAVYRQVILGGRLSYLSQLLGRPVEQQQPTAAAAVQSFESTQAAETGAAAAARSKSLQAWEALKAATEKNLLRLLQEAVPNIRIRLELFLSLGPSFNAAAAECCRMLDDKCLYLPQGALAGAARERLTHAAVPEVTLSPSTATAAYGPVTATAEQRLS
ncbi:hypothetical protein, conserved [Eimeria praecox]|uniref:Uncharacterized protein n=1 Tax=Eimeria praecox TaxID=51316 RepID=U6GHG9_9EIME|nr:hypothetical protein, conserved [Eimeria praecox]